MEPPFSLTEALGVNITRMRSIRSKHRSSRNLLSSFRSIRVDLSIFFKFHSLVAFSSCVTKLPVLLSIQIAC